MAAAATRGGQQTDSELDDRIAYGKEDAPLMKRLFKRVKWIVHYIGISGLLLTVALRVAPPLGRVPWLARRKEAAFDRRFGVETAGIVEPSMLDFGDDVKEHAVEYSPTEGSGFGVIMDELGIDYRRYTFIDFGCGKGRVLVMAAEFGFGNIVGVEASAILLRAAQANIHRYQGGRHRRLKFEGVHSDATEYQFPTTPLVVYFFNPFGEQIMQRVVDGLEASLEGFPRDAIVVYSNPVHRNVFDSSNVWEQYALSNGSAPRGWAVFRHVSKAAADRIGMGRTAC